ncbi:VOC family protein [Ponticaulis koreensis]|uniref:VOC family protein n=1 Tax=Ponticaulis koreensis TaxID=1123045 RepID=UPI0003B722AF|nr:VOC family protein [Ponticaulis koreensis]
MTYTGIRCALAAALIVSMAAAPAIANHHEEAEHVEHAVTAPASIAAAAISVSDLDAATAFYTQGLGMSVVRNSSGPGYVEAILSTADAEGTKLALIQVTEGEASIGPSRIVFYTEDAAGMIDAIRAAGFEVEREAIPVREGMSLIIAIGHDGDGNTLEFIQR